MNDAPAPLPRTKDDRIGHVLAGKLRLDSVLGEGGMGIVYAAHHTFLDRKLAVKVLNDASAQDDSRVKRFLAEARAAAKIRHPNVIEVVDMGRDPESGSVYMALELLEGETLGALLEREGTIPAARAVELICPVMEGLAVAHDAGIVHRDIKPENIFLARGTDGQITPKMLDFGVAKLLDATPDMRVTRSGVVVGTPLYMSPEQASNRGTVGVGSDVWSMGVVLYEALSGAVPFQASGYAELFAALLTQRPMPLSTCAPNVPAEVGAVVDRALARFPTERYADMRALRDAFMRAASASVPQTGAAPSAAARSRLANAETVSATAAQIASSDGARDAAAKSPARALGTIPSIDVAPRRLGPWLVGGAVVLLLLGIVALLALRSNTQASSDPASTPVAGEPHDQNLSGSVPSQAHGPAASPFRTLDHSPTDVPSPAIAIPSPPPVASPSPTAVPGTVPTLPTPSLRTRGRMRPGRSDAPHGAPSPNGSPEPSTATPTNRPEPAHSAPVTRTAPAVDRTF